MLRWYGRITEDLETPEFTVPSHNLSLMIPMQLIRTRARGAPLPLPLPQIAEYLPSLGRQSSQSTAVEVVGVGNVHECCETTQ